MTKAAELAKIVDASGNVVTSGTVEPAGDTAAGDNAAIGFTSAEGIVITGQGSTNDVTIKNDADADVIEIPTGTTNVTIAGTLTATGFIIGSADINENDLESIDGITAGTIAASKAAIVDTNKDITGFRNITLTGELDAATLDVSGDADIDGTLEADAITVNGTALATVIAGTTVTTATNANHVSVADNESTNEENLIPFIEDTSATGNVGLESDGDFAYNPSTGTVSATVFKGNIDAVDGDFDGTLEADAITIGGTAIASVLSPVAGSSSIVTTGALNSGSITSGFGAIDTGSSTITTTGAVATGTLTVVDDVSIQGSTPTLTLADTDVSNNKVELSYDEFLTIDLDPNNARGSTGLIVKGDGNEALRLTSDRHLLIGTTTTNPADNNDASGLQLSSIGSIQASVSNATPAIFNRGDNGAITGFLKAGVSVGSIGYVATGQYIQGETDHSGIRFGGNQLVPFRNGADTDATTDLGATSVRYRNLYLSGGAYIGGTGSSNLLNDYEEGTWTVTLTGADFGSYNQTAYYTKIGQQVFFNYYTGAFDIANAGNTAGFTGLPFTSSNNTQQYGLFLYVHGSAITSSRGGYVIKNDTRGIWVTNDGVADRGYVNGSGKYIMIGGSYQTSS